MKPVFHLFDINNLTEFTLNCQEFSLPSPQAYFPTLAVGIGKVRRSVKVFPKKDLTTGWDRVKYEYGNRKKQVY